jgi:diguanylate cyclase (GGDEF)-like protein
VRIIVLDYYALAEKGLFYYEIQKLFSAYPFLHWMSVGLVTGLLIVLLLIPKKTMERFPRYGYMASVLLTIALLDLFTLSIPILTVYLIVLGYVLFRSNEEKSYKVAVAFLSVYLVISALTVWNRLMIIELISHGLLFIWVTWMANHVRDIFFELQKQREKIRFLVDQKNEANQRLRDFQRELDETYLRDSLTGLYNFHGFQEQVIRSLSRFWPETAYHVICIDLNSFRQINIEEGIETGDRILVQIARQLKKHLPPSAKLARYDGDQYAIGLMGDESVLRRLLETIEAIMAGIRTEQSIIQYCVGFASYPREASTGGELIRLAEERLRIEQNRIRHKEEEQRRHMEKLSAVGQLAAGLAHEIRNPLTSIRGFVQISAAESEAVKKWESIILPEIDRINDLLKQFLNLSESKPKQVTRFSLNQLMSDVLSLLEPKSLLMGHELKQDPPEEDMEIEADPEQIKQVLINLIQNGLEALNEKGKVEVGWKRVNQYVLITVKDNGNGINPENFSRIFDPFFTTKGDGTGMGLSICQRIVSEHGGQITVNSRPGRGTTFQIYLPLKQTSICQETDEGQAHHPQTDPDPGAPESNVVPVQKAEPGKEEKKQGEVAVLQKSAAGGKKVPISPEVSRKIADMMQKAERTIALKWKEEAKVSPITGHKRLKEENGAERKGLSEKEKTDFAHRAERAVK